MEASTKFIIRWFYIIPQGFIKMGILGRFGGKERSNDDSGQEVNHPMFNGRKDFISSCMLIAKMYATKKLHGKSVLRPWVDNNGWLDPAFREKLALVVTKNNHCVL
jgi:hypothetical protein